MFYIVNPTDYVKIMTLLNDMNCWIQSRMSSMSQKIWFVHPLLFFFIYGTPSVQYSWKTCFCKTKIDSPMSTRKELDCFVESVSFCLRRVEPQSSVMLLLGEWLLIRPKSFLLQTHNYGQQAVHAHRMTEQTNRPNSAHLLTCLCTKSIHSNKPIHLYTIKAECL